jgi:hypothetical protein
VTELTVIAVDWSGRKDQDQIHHIRVAIVTPDGHLDVWCDLTRDDVVGELDLVERPVVVGFDFSFGFPDWVGRCHGIDFGPSLWPLVTQHAGNWLASCPPPFFGAKGTTVPALERFRETEKVNKAKSTFQLAGAGHVGTCSLRGMPFLQTMRAGGFSVWPFDGASERTVVEIYPRVLRERADVSRLSGRHRRAIGNSEDRRDAVLSAVVMAEHRTTLASLSRTHDATTRLEGTIWCPTATSP